MAIAKSTILILILLAAVYTCAQFHGWDDLPSCAQQCFNDAFMSSTSDCGKQAEGRLSIRVCTCSSSTYNNTLRSCLSKSSPCSDQTITDQILMTNDQVFCNQSIDAAVSWGGLHPLWAVCGAFGATVSTSINLNCPAPTTEAGSVISDPGSTSFSSLFADSSSTTTPSTSASDPVSFPCTSAINSSSYAPSVPYSAPAYPLPSLASSSDPSFATPLASIFPSTHSTHSQVPSSPHPSAPSVYTSSTVESRCLESPHCYRNTAITISITSTSYVTTTITSSLPTSIPGAPTLHFTLTSAFTGACQSTFQAWESTKSSIAISTGLTSAQQSSFSPGYPTLVTLTSAGSITSSNSWSSYESSDSSSGDGYGTSQSTRDGGGIGGSSDVNTSTGPQTQTKSQSLPVTTHASTPVTTGSITSITSRTSESTSTSTDAVPTQTGGVGILDFRYEAIFATCLLTTVWVLILGL
ncbi:uncharacterized protein Z519_04422 [Cladophialophora bantiana CBS 173.52]|uniref:CFEM domain-containing protein n=1 Tax=Cladophialophora bantiana (strain ATCC 10958 / CBS 173.52 / CDC B-1940 / NIH 8579) TaxID=1442370 RepID=A0A0D2EX38_CLAB1|nr:uncharacterized protein Z519_04422 [Cladophialophora bantiana CBS 173.52]KIW94446.1 hypothetical protein Z519_04422 [Cladophialophora bantiana CBS 173.52]